MGISGFRGELFELSRGEFRAFMGISDFYGDFGLSWRGFRVFAGKFRTLIGISSLAGFK